MGKLTNLKALYVGYNKLTKLPEILSNLKNIEKIPLTDNKFIKPPENITSWLKELTERRRIVYAYGLLD